MIERSKYINVEDFATDESFQKWVLEDDNKTNEFWNNWLSRNKDKNDVVNNARVLVENLNFQMSIDTKKEAILSWEKIESSIIQNRTVRQIRGKSLIRKFSKVAAVLVLLLSIAGLYLLAERYVFMDDITEISVPNGEQKTFELPDGSRVWLNSGSSITYTKRYNKKYRKIELLGQAYFDVVKDPKSPFIVETKYLDIEVLGTAFDVMAYSNSDVFRTTLERGKLKVSTHNNGYNILNPNQVCYYSVYSGKTEVRNIDTYQYTSWKEGYIIFSNETFKDIANVLERRFDKSFEIGDDMLAVQRYTGEFRKEDSLEKILKIFNITTEFNYKIEKNRVLID